MQQMLNKQIGLVDSHRLGLYEMKFLPSSSGNVRNIRTFIDNNGQAFTKIKQNNNQSCDRSKIRLMKKFSHKNQIFINENMDQNINVSQNKIQRYLKPSRKTHFINSTSNQIQRIIYLIRSHLELISLKVDQFQAGFIQTNSCQTTRIINADILGTSDCELSSLRLKKLHKLVRLLKIAQKFTFQTQFQPEQIQISMRNHQVGQNKQPCQVQQILSSVQKKSLIIDSTYDQQSKSSLKYQPAIKSTQFQEEFNKIDDDFCKDEKTFPTKRKLFTGNQHKVLNTQVILPSLSIEVAIKSISLSLHVLNLFQHELSQDLSIRIRRQRSRIQNSQRKKLCPSFEYKQKISQMEQNQLQINQLRNVLVKLKNIMNRLHLIIQGYNFKTILNLNQDNYTFRLSGFLEHLRNIVYEELVIELLIYNG